MVVRMPAGIFQSFGFVPATMTLTRMECSSVGCGMVTSWRVMVVSLETCASFMVPGDMADGFV